MRPPLNHWETQATVLGLRRPEQQGVGALLLSGALLGAVSVILTNVLLKIPFSGTSANNSPPHPRAKIVRPLNRTHQPYFPLRAVCISCRLPAEDK